MPATHTGFRRGVFAREARLWVAWVPLTLLPLAALGLLGRIAPWAWMWTMAGSLYFGCKWLTWYRARAAGFPTLRDWAYLLLWPGMDAPAFLDARGTRPPMPTQTAWAAAVAQTLLGFLLLWGMAGRVPASLALLKGWTGMLGVIFTLHFGLFQLLALLWQSLGINARPLMRAPFLADSLADFWGNRWNTAFHLLARDLIYRPVHTGLRHLAIRLPRRNLRIHLATVATLIAFAISGLIHELLLSVPARGGYGLPTAYFLLQGAGLLFEHSPAGRELGLRHGWRGRAFAVAVTAGPMVWLFQPLFIRNVILPMLHAIGAT
jgi:alginate O-acetyltransferase complex protein AlgI